MLINFDAMTSVGSALDIQDVMTVVDYYRLRGLEQHENGYWYAYQPYSGQRVRITQKSVDSVKFFTGLINAIAS